MTDETTLLPCPICGKKVSIARTENEVGERWWFITRGTYKTTRCNCRLFLESEKFTCDWNDDYSLECRTKLIEKWNTRATHGMLTAEQVRKAIFNGSSYASYDGAQYYANGISMQAIADELNAELGSGTCENEWAQFGKFRCSKCWLQVDSISTNTTAPIPIKHCPNCGAKVVG